MENLWLEELKAALGARYVLTDPMDLWPYASDGYTLVEAMPRAVVLPADTASVQEVVRILRRARIPYLARGAGTSLSGGAIPLDGAVIIHLSRLNQIWEVDPDNRVIVVGPGVVNAEITKTLAPYGFFYAPDPSSQQTCTICGNFAENSGGPHCLKYGVTVNHMLMAEVVTASGDVAQLGNLAGEPDGLDWLGVVIGSEGTLAIATKLWLRITLKPEQSRTLLALFDDVDEASRAVSDVVAEGVIPAAMEMMDRLAIHAVEQGSYPVGYPPDVEAVLLIEVDGEADEVAATVDRVYTVLTRHRVREVRVARTPEEEARWWANRKTAFGAMGIIGPQYYVQDGVIPRSRLPEALSHIAAIADRYQIRIANVFHAGDGNLHPLLLYDKRDADMVRRVVEAGSEILQVCMELGGTITGEHGVGLEKLAEMEKLFSPEELKAQRALKWAFDRQGLLNPGKLLPSGPKCHQEGASLDRFAVEP